MSSTRTQYPGILHHISQTPHLTAFEHLTPLQPSSTITTPINTLLFLGGLGDGLLHPLYPSQLALLLPYSWRIVEVLLTSSYTGWTTGNLPRDADEVVLAVAYFRGLEGRGEGKVVLLGHSTGAQVCMEYVTFRAAGKQQERERKSRVQDTSTTNTSTSTASSPPPPPTPRPQISALILQAGISDHENLTSSLPLPLLHQNTILARRMHSTGNSSDHLPSQPTLTAALGATPTASRFLSLIDHNGDDDYFSSDLPDSELELTFGKVGEVGCPLLVLLSGGDEFMPRGVDKEGVVRGRGGTWGRESGVVIEARHALDGEGAEGVVEVVAGRVGRFLEGL